MTSNDTGKPKAARIARLRARLKAVETLDPMLRAILLGFLDLLGDEL